MVGGGSKTPKATMLEKQLAAQAAEMYNASAELNGGKDYLTAEATKVDRTDRYAEQANSDVAAALAQTIKNPLANEQSDLRAYGSGTVAAKAQAESEQERAALSLANSGLGTKTLTDQAVYKHAADEQRTQAVNDEAKAIKNSFIPTVLGTTVGAVATTTEGRKWMKDLFSSPEQTPTPKKKPFTGSFS